MLLHDLWKLKVQVWWKLHCALKTRFILSPLTRWNLNQFSQFFHCWKKRKLKTKLQAFWRHICLLQENISRSDKSCLCGGVGWLCRCPDVCPLCPCLWTSWATSWCYLSSILCPELVLNRLALYPFNWYKIFNRILSLSLKTMFTNNAVVSYVDICILRWHSKQVIAKINK